MIDDDEIKTMSIYLHLTIQREGDSAAVHQWVQALLDQPFGRIYRCQSYLLCSSFCGHNRGWPTGASSWATVVWLIRSVLRVKHWSGRRSCWGRLWRRPPSKPSQVPWRTSSRDAPDTKDGPGHVVPKFSQRQSLPLPDCGQWWNLSFPYKTSSRFFTSPEGFSPSGDVWCDSGDVVSPREA